MITFIYLPFWWRALQKEVIWFPYSHKSSNGRLPKYFSFVFQPPPVKDLNSNRIYLEKTIAWSTFMRFIRKNSVITEWFFVDGTPKVYVMLRALRKFLLCKVWGVKEGSTLRSLDVSSKGEEDPSTRSQRIIRVIKRIDCWDLTTSLRRERR